MGEMTDLADIVGDLYMELDLPTAIGEETLTADQLTVVLTPVVLTHLLIVSGVNTSSLKSSL